MGVTNHLTGMILQVLRKLVMMRGKLLSTRLRRTADLKFDGEANTTSWDHGREFDGAWMIMGILLTPPNYPPPSQMMNFRAPGIIIYLISLINVYQALPLFEMEVNHGSRFPIVKISEVNHCFLEIQAIIHVLYIQNIHGTLLFY